MRKYIHSACSLACAAAICLPSGCAASRAAARLSEQPKSPENGEQTAGRLFVPAAVAALHRRPVADKGTAAPTSNASTVRPADFGQPSVEVGDEVDPHQMTFAADSSSEIRALFESNETSPRSEPMTKYVVARVEYVPLETPPVDVPPAQAADPAMTLDDHAEPPAATLDFATALALVSGQNPKVSFAQQRICEAFARLEAARALWLPSIRAGMNYNKHEGSIQDVAGANLDVSRGALYTGLGARAVGAGSPSVAGVFAEFHLTDAIFQPMIAERTACARQHGSEAVRNDVLLDAAIAYLELLRAVQSQTIARTTLANAQQLADQTAAFAKSGRGPQADADRAQTELTLRQNELTRAEEAVAVASARLAQVLSLDASLDMHPAEPTVAPIELVAAETPLAELLATALYNRPEVGENQHLVCAAVDRLRRERYAPLVPSVLLGMSYGGFGAGVGGDIDNYRDRFDFDAAAFWEVRNFGFGERAARNAAHAQMQQARFREVQVLDQVARETAEAYAQVQSSRKQIAVAEAGIQSAEDSYRRNVERIRQGQGLPIEVLQAIQALDQARREYLRVVTDFNAAQFRLHRALGWPIEQPAP